MNAAHFHLIVNHIPIIFPMAGLIVLISGMLVRSDAIKRSSYLIFIIGSMASIIAMISGEGASDVLEQISGISENHIERHENFATIFSILTYILGALSLLAFWANLKEKSYSKILGIIVMIFTFVVIYFAKLTGNSGGEIRHTEIRTEYKKTSGNQVQSQVEEEGD